MSRRPRFAVVTAVVTILAILGGIAQLLRPLIPPQAHAFNNYADKGGFLEQARNEPIRWLQLLDTDFTEATQLHRPVLLVVGGEWSREGRLADKTSFADGDVQALIGSDYLPVRVDCDESPEWLNAYFPISYHTLGLDRGCQAYILTQRGAFYDFFQSGTFSEHPDNIAATQGLLTGKSGVDPSSNHTTQSARLLIRDINALMSPALGRAPDYAAFLNTLRAGTDPVHGGFPEDESQSLMPNAYLFEMIAGDLASAAQGIEPLLKSPIVDWMDGGFFRLANQDWSDVQFDKVAVSNAEMMLAAAQYAHAAHDPFAARIARDTWDSIASQFLLSQGLLSAARIGDEQEDGRSARCSFAARDFRALWSTNILPDADRRWAIINLNLKLDRNDQLVPFVSNPSIVLLQNDRLGRVLHELRAAKAGYPQKFSVIGYADVTGFVDARLIECARLWQDPNRLKRALEIATGLEKLRTGPDMTHRMHPVGIRPELTDYLAYSDAALQEFLATGNADQLDYGAEVLAKARRLFELQTPGAWLMARGSPRGLPTDYLSPQIADSLYESCTAREIRLMNDYALLLQGNSVFFGMTQGFRKDAYAAMAQFAPAASALGMHAAGFYRAAYQMEHGSAIFTVGPDCLTSAGRLAAKYQFALCAPALGPVRLDLQRGQPGIYLVRNGITVGPLGEKELASRYSAKY